MVPAKATSCWTHQGKPDGKLNWNSCFVHSIFLDGEKLMETLNFSSLWRRCIQGKLRHSRANRRRKPRLKFLPRKSRVFYEEKSQLVQIVELELGLGNSSPSKASKEETLGKEKLLGSKPKPISKGFEVFRVRFEKKRQRWNFVASLEVTWSEVQVTWPGQTETLQPKTDFMGQIGFLERHFKFERGEANLKLSFLYVAAAQKLNTIVEKQFHDSKQVLQWYLKLRGWSFDDDSNLKKIRKTMAAISYENEKVASSSRAECNCLSLKWRWFLVYFSGFEIAILRTVGKLRSNATKPDDLKLLFQSQNIWNATEAIQLFFRKWWSYLAGSYVLDKEGWQFWTNRFGLRSGEINLIPRFGKSEQYLLQLRWTIKECVKISGVNDHLTKQPARAKTNYFILQEEKYFSSRAAKLKITSSSRNQSKQ